MTLSRLARISFSIGLVAAGTTGCVKGLIGGSTSTSSTASGGDSYGSSGSSGASPGGSAVAGGDPYPAPDKPGTIDPSAPQGVQDLWTAFVAMHQGATVANAEQTGKKIWGLLSADVHGDTARLGRLLRQFRSDKVGVDQESLTYRWIGEIAAQRANRIVGADIEVKMRSRDDGSVTAEFTGHYGGDLIPDFEAREEDGVWQFVPSGGLFAGPAEDHGTTEVEPRPASVEALATEWTRVLEHGRGRDAWRLISSGTHNVVLSAANQDGLDHFAVLLVLDAALAARQARKVAITGHTVERETFTLTYADGTTETYAADDFGDDWFVDLM